MEEEEGEKKGEAFPNTGGRALCCHLDQRGPFIRAGTVSTPLTFGKGELECVHVQAFGDGSHPSNITIQGLLPLIKLHLQFEYDCWCVEKSLYNGLLHY